MYKTIFFLFFLSFFSCQYSNTENKSELDAQAKQSIDTFQFYTDTSNLKNEYQGFHSPKAINKIANIENEYFNNVDQSGSRYYGTEWKKLAVLESANDSLSVFEAYQKNMETLGFKPDSLHCTLYAMKALKAGLDTNFFRFEALHKEIYKEHEYAGWSVAYILTKYFDWEAYLIISKSSGEYDDCIKNFQKNKSYKVWKQPNIPIQAVYDFDEEQVQIDSLLNQNEFGWGFSYQGWHTWLTRFNTLKECNWAGSPNSKYSTMPLFYNTKFTSYYAYNSHIVVFPQKK